MAGLEYVKESKIFLRNKPRKRILNLPFKILIPLQGIVKVNFKKSYSPSELKIIYFKRNNLNCFEYSYNYI